MYRDSERGYFDLEFVDCAVVLEVLTNEMEFFVQINQAEFTEMAWQAIVASPDVAKESKQQIVETEHLMKALLEQRNGLARRIFAKAGVDNTSLLQATDRFIQRQPKVRSNHFVLNPGFCRNCRQVVVFSKCGRFA